MFLCYISINRLNNFISFSYIMHVVLALLCWDQITLLVICLSIFFSLLMCFILYVVLFLEIFYFSCFCLIFALYVLLLAFYIY